MRKLVLTLCVAIPAMAFAQEIKPSIPKADKALRAGKIDEAKSIIDATTSNQEFMVDKKGQPSKSAAKAWFLKGVIYAAIDTTKNEKFKSLDTNAFATAKSSFDKAKELDPKALFFLNDINGLPIMMESQFSYFAQAYFNQAIDAYQVQKDYKKAFLLTEETLYFIPNDTSILMNAGVYFGPQAQEYDKSIVYIRRYIEKGGKSVDAYYQLLSIYMDKLKDNEKALEVVKEAEVKFPNNSDLPKYELNLYVKMERLPDAKTAMERQIKADPSNKESWYYLGVINKELKDHDGSRKAFEEAVKLDPKYFDAALGLADVVYDDAREVKSKMNQLGITAEDKKKRFELDKVYVEKLKVALPYFETAEKLSPDEPRVLDTLLGIYSDLDNQPQVARVSKHMKALGLLD